ncbi:hypothetical protein FTO74_11460 [Granulicella sp. WH15]|uniref:hypothetical protein n=1 Tax=Granulicella sp. WH15 TaxID=2602070 RepID=UPI0013671C82|nr:hypothetical protein [Granulicella sp. WH15]QHN03917.1 hypothetical protein FTO74_11460 [Granulicella sp. WH15]
MNEKMRRFKKLAILYGQVEQIRSAQLRIASSAANEVVQATAYEISIRQRQAAYAHDALTSGDRESWSLSAVQATVATTRQLRLESLRITREDAHEQAAAAYHNSRQRLEQMKAVIDKGYTLASLEELHRAQAASDDRFLSRRAWIQAQSDARSRMK